MKVSNTSYQGIMKVLCIIIAAGLLTVLFSSYAASATTDATAKPGASTSEESKSVTTPPSEIEQLSPEESERRAAWRNLMILSPKPKKGCFKVTYPNTEWQEVPCTEAPPYPMTPRSGPRPLTVGNGDDICAQAPSGFISTAIGSFDSVTGVTSESGPVCSGTPVANSYSLQINTNFFASTACSSAAVPADCQGFEQFVYSNDGSSGSLYIQYWLISYNTPCPAGWTSYSYPGPTDTSCYKNSSATSVPNQPVTNLGQLILSGTVSASDDSVTLSTGTTVYSVTGDNSVNAASGWQIAEFNVFGNHCSAQADFNNGSTIVPRTRIIYGSQDPPLCVAQGFTGETNNLSFGPSAPASSQPGPAVFFTESSAGGAPSNCAAATSVGDTHLATFNGLFYDFQASGDFILAQVDPDFVVQTRQVSGAPTWPDASVNNAVATRMGKTEIAICLASEGHEMPALLNIDGKPTDLGDGKSLSLPDGIDIVRRGNVYAIMGPSGNSVRAQVNTTWINVSVGLGRWPVKVRGLVSNPNENVNQIEASDGTVLTNPFPFENLYQHYADSWRVPAEESILSICGDRKVERGSPEKPFYAHDLDPEVYNRTRAVCLEAGVKEGPLLDACTLDVAVIGDDAAAKVFVSARAPVAVGIPIVTTSPHAWPGFKVLFLLLLVVIAFILWLLIRKMRTSS